MANKYYTFEELMSYEVGNFKPGGTLGKHHAIIVEKFPSCIEIKGSAGGESVFIREGYTLGYDCGKVWSIQPANEISDPLIRVLRELKISSKALVIHDEEIQVYLEHNICGAGYARSGTSIKILGDGWNHRYTGRPPEWYPGGNVPHPDEGEYYSSGEVAIVTKHWCDSNFSASRSRISQVVVRSSVSRERAASLIRHALIDAPRMAQEKRENDKKEKEIFFSKCAQEFSDFLEEEKTFWKATVAQGLAEILLKKEGIKAMHPYNASNYPDKVFPLNEKIWTNGKIDIIIDDFTFVKVRVQHTSILMLYEQFSAFAFEFDFPKFEFNVSFDEKMKQVDQLTLLKDDLTRAILEKVF